MLFNRKQIEDHSFVEPQPSREIETSPGLFRASPEDAMIYGGDLTRWVLSEAPITNDFKYVTIDTKVHMLFPGMIPAIPGWHTDGAPRNESIYGQKQAPDLYKQDQLTNDGQTILYHLLVSGTPTTFLMESLELDIDEEPYRDLYRDLKLQVDALDMQATDLPSLYLERWTIPSWQWITFDWWSLHQAEAAKEFQWRYMIRITESDYIAPQSDLRRVLRNQQQVYVSDAYGW